MTKQIYTENSVIRTLSKIRDIDIDTRNKSIYIIKGTTQLGNSSYGKIDYLIKVHGYKSFYVDTLSKSRATVDTKIDNDSSVIVKANKRDKINMVSMVKNTMKKIKKM